MKTTPILFAVLSLIMITLIGCVSATEDNNNTSATTNENVAVSNDQIKNDVSIYENELYGFSLKYPINWSIKEYDAGREARMGASSGTIIIESGNCIMFGEKVNDGTIKNEKEQTTDTKHLKEIQSSAGIEGITFSDVINEKGDVASIYVYSINDNEIRFIPVSGASDKNCSESFIEIIDSIASNMLTWFENSEYGFRFNYDNTTLDIDDSYTETTNFNTTNTYSIVRLSLDTDVPNPTMSFNVSENSTDTILKQIMVEDAAVTKLKSTSSLSGKNVTVITVTGSTINTTLYLYEIGSKTMIISVPDLVAFDDVKESIQFLQ